MWSVPRPMDDWQIAEIVDLESLDLIIVDGGVRS